MRFHQWAVHELRHRARATARPFWFEAEMTSSCPGVFDDCSGNYEVEKLLREARVLLPKDVSDTETCALVVTWSTREEGLAFLDRLNEYLEGRGR